MTDRIVERRRPHGVPCFVAALTLVAVVVGWADVAGAAVYSNTGAISIPVNGTNGESSPYPSTITVDASLPITDVNVTLTGLTHAYPIDLDILLVGPGGKSVLLMSDVGGITPISDLNLTFDDAASASIPTPAAPPQPTISGTFKPTNYGASFGGGYPAPAGPYGTALSVFNGSIADGPWKLFVFDDYSASGGGSISGGWSLDITTAPTTTVTSFAPATGKVGDTVTITGKSFTGATGVKFGATPVGTFTIDSDTQITTTVPAGAGTGPIAVAAPNGTGKSATDFVVSHSRAVSLTLSGKKGKGTIDVDDGFTGCASDVPVTVQHLKKGKWHAVAGDFTNSNGAYSTVGLVAAGKYRTVAKSTTLPSGDVCPKAVSPVTKK